MYLSKRKYFIKINDFLKAFGLIYNLATLTTCRKIS
jgi:hypothetical protein